MMRQFLPTILVFGLARANLGDSIPDVIHDNVTSSKSPNFNLTRKSLETQILYTNITKSILHPIYSTSSFETFICHSRLFMDNSLLINYLFHNNKTLVTLPRAFGKTNSLLMVKTFFQIEVNKTTGERLKLEETKSYEIFIKREINCGERTITLRDDFLITFSNYSDVMKHLGSKPVLHLDLSIPGPLQTLNDVKLLMKRRIENSILEHDFIKLPRYESYHRKFDELLDQLSTAGMENLPKVLPSLAKILENIFTEKVLLLIDDYDSPINEVFLDNSKLNHDQRSKATSFIGSVYGELLNSSSIQHVFFTGILFWEDHKIFPGFDKFTLNTAAGGKANRYYGFAEDHVETMLKEIAYEQAFAGTKSYYKGYDFGAAKQIIKYNPISIGFHLTNRNPEILEPYWSFRGNFYMLFHNLVKYSNFNKILYQALIGGYISIPTHWLTQDSSPILSLKFEDMYRLINAAENVSLLYEVQWYSTRNPIAEVGFKVLFALGFLTRARITESLHHIDLNCTILAKIPNTEVEHYLWLQYGSSLGILTDDTSQIDQLYEASMNFNKLFAHLVQTNFTNGKNFAIELKKFMKAYPPLNAQKCGVPLHNNQRIIESLIEAHLLSILYRLDLVSREIQPMFNWNKRSRPDIALITRQKRMVIIELKYNNTITANETMTEVKKFATWYMDKRNARNYGQILDFKLISIIVRKTLRKRIEVNIEIIPPKNLKYTSSSFTSRKLG